MKKGSWAVFASLLASGALWAQSYLISTVAGGGGMPITPSQALSVTLPPPVGTAVDASGNVYFSSANLVFKLDGSGILTTVAGTGKAGFSGDGGPATSARVNYPQGVAVDPAGNVYIADTFNNVIRKIAAGSGVITTVAGTPGTFGYQDGPAAQAQLSEPYSVALDSAGNLYIADYGNAVIRKIANGAVSTVAGNYALGPGYAGDGGSATQAQLSQPQSVAVDSGGNLYIADTGNSRIRKVANGTITTFAGNGTAGYLGDNGQATQAEINLPNGVAVDAAGNLYIADTSNYRVRKVASGTITTVAGTGVPGFTGDGGPAVSAQLDRPGAVGVDGSGNLYIADVANCRIRKVAGGTITTVAGGAGGGQAGAGIWGYAGDNGPATQAELYQPAGAAVDSAGNLYIADAYNYVIRKVTPNGTITTVAGTGKYGYSGDGGQATSATMGRCYGIAVDTAGNIYTADIDNSVIRKVTVATGIITTVAGNGTAGYNGDQGPATFAYLDQPFGVAVDSAGNIYIADTGNNVVRGVSATNGYIFTLVGDGFANYYGDGGPANLAELDTPSAVAVDAAGNLYIADSNNDAIRAVSAVNGLIFTVAGGNSTGFSGDGGQAASAQLSFPTGVAVDSAGNYYIADYYNVRVRKVANGIITTIAGSGSEGYAGDGGAATLAEFELPAGVALDSSGNVYIADDSNNVVRMLVPENTHALLTVSSLHAANFTLGSTGAIYSIVVSNTALAGATSGTVTVTETAPAGLTLVSMAGSGWNCSASTCSRSDALAAGASYPPITVTANVAVSAASLVVNQVAVSGGGSAAASGIDLTSITPAVLAAPGLISPANGATVVANGALLSWNAATAATSYDVYFGTLSTPSKVTNTTATTYSPGTLTAGATYYWQIVARNSTGTASTAIWAFTAVSAVTGLRFVPVPPCRVADTRQPGGPFGGPSMTTNSSRDFVIPQSGCGIPSTAKAYSLNVTVVPDGLLSFLTLWPAGGTKPFVSTLNSFGGIVVANAAIVPAGTGGAVSVFVTDPTDVILDINGYFDTSTGPNSFSFYPATPCRVADTRFGSGQFGAPSMHSGQSRDFPIPVSSCGMPSTASAYSLNVTVVPPGYLGYLTTWPTGQAQPNVSTLNSWTGKVVANAALVPSGTNGSASVFVSDPTDVILDTNGYFAPPGGTDALTFYPVTPCRVADTRGDPGEFGGPAMEAQTTRSFTIPASACSIPATAAAYSLNVTVVPSGVLPYLTTWPTGSGQPGVSTLNSFDGSVVANAAIVPAGTGGAISVYVDSRTNVILDINGYFAP
jgi:sugar lactone lactonase YvrE